MKIGLGAGLSAAALALATPAMGVPADFSAKADSIVNHAWPADGPGGAVIVTEGGKTIYERGRGLANVETKNPIAPDTVFRIGSITKQFSAAVLLQLIHEGKLSLDDPLSKFLPDYPQPGASATVRELLNHTSGIQSYTDIPGWMVEANTNRPYTTQQLIDVFKDKPQVTKPGETWAYNNSGYILVGAIIEKVTGKPWYQAVHDRIAVPLHLTTLRYGTAESATPNMATGYAIGADGKAGAAPKIDMSVPGAAGALIGTVGDLATWANALHHGRVLDPVSYKEMITPTKTADGKEWPYGFGMAVGDIRGHLTIGHDGGIFGFVTSSVYVPEKDVFVAVFVNSLPPVTAPDMVASKLAMLAIGDPFPVFHAQPVDVKAVEPLLGVYEIEGGDAERLFYERDGKLFTRRTGGSDTEVFPAGDNRYFYEGGVTWFDIKPGMPPVMQMYQNGASEPELAKRTGPVPPEPKAADVPRSTLERYVGTYTVGGNEAVVLLDEKGLTVKLGDQPTLRLTPTSTTEFSVEQVDAKVVFTAGAEGPASKLTILQAGHTIEAPRKR
jgi:CubicO group peptidase (beta-lactamase class C family)